MLEKNRVARPARAAEIADNLEPFLTAASRPRKAAATGPNRVGSLFYLAGGIVGGAAAFALARPYALESGAVAAALGVGGALAFGLFPRVGEIAFWLRVALVTAALALAGLVGALAGGHGAYLPVGLSLGGLLVFVLYSAGWGRRARIAAVLMGGLLAPAVAILLLPYPTGQGYSAIWGLSGQGGGSFGPALAMLAVGLAFSLAGLGAPGAREAAAPTVSGREG
jgi:hypothetical protein